jgi:O-antigen/teichoic acid export membrane protein
MAGAVGVGFLNYAFYPIMGRILQPDAFGEVQVLFSLFAQITIFLNVLSLLTVTITANYTDLGRRDRMVRELEKLALAGGVTFVIAAALAAPVLRNFFHFEHTLPFVLLALAVLAGTPLAFRSGFLRGRKKFGLVTSISLAASVANIIFSASLATAGLGSAGVLAGLAIGQAIGFGLAAFLARQQGLGSTRAIAMAKVGDAGAADLSDLSDSSSGSNPRDIKKGGIDFSLITPELKYAGLVLIGSLCVTSMYSLDTIVIKHYFDAQTAGLYAGIATVGRIIFFITASVLQVMLPSVKQQAGKQQNQRLLSKSLLLLLVTGGLPLLAFTLFPERIITLLMGNTYAPYAHLLPALGLAMLIVAALNLLVMYHIALRRFAAGIIAVAGIVSTYLLIILFHHTPGQIVACLCIGSTLSLVVLGVWSGRQVLTRAPARTQEGGTPA